MQAPVNNRSFYKSLSTESRLNLIGFLLLQCVILVIVASKLAVHYDEWYSYRNFSSQKLHTILSFYFTSNNHVFYNVLSHFFVALPGDLPLLMRLTSVLATVIGSWYLFKLCKIYSAETTAWLVVIIYSSMYTVMLYAAQARGYGLLNLFTILSIYHTVQYKYTGISKSKVYLVILQAVGLFTVPTFMYCVLPIYLYLLFNLPRKNFTKAFFSLGLQALITLLLALLLYLPILTSENASVLLHTNTSEGKFSLADPNAVESILYFLKKMYHELLGISYPLYSFLAISALLLWRRKKTQTAVHLYTVCITVLVSPALIILLHNYFAYGRNWLFLCVPAVILLLLIAEPIAELAKRVVTGTLIRKLLKQAVYVVMLLYYGYAYVHFLERHKKEYAIDYKMAEIANALPQIKSIAITEGGFEFYAADVLQGGLEGRMLKGQVPIKVLTSQPQQDLLIIGVDRVAQNKVNLQNYKATYFSNNLFFFTKKH